MCDECYVGLDCCEDVYILACRDKNGNFNKIVKSYERWFYSMTEAQQCLDGELADVREFYSIFKVEMSFRNIEKIK